MGKFRKYLREEYMDQQMLFEASAQSQIIKHHGDKILERTKNNNLNFRFGTTRAFDANDQVYQNLRGFGTPEHKDALVHHAIGIPNHDNPHHRDFHNQLPRGFRESMLVDTTKEAVRTRIANATELHKKNPEHINWILTRYANKGIAGVEDIHSRAIPALKDYTSLVASGKMKKESLSKWKTLPELETAVRNAKPTEAGELEAHHYDHIGENEHWNVYHPKTEKAACVLGHGTSWCTVSKSNSMFDHYNQEGPLHIFVPKKPDHKGEKYQLHAHSGQFRDYTDDPIDIDDIPVSPVSGRNRPLPKEYLNHPEHGKMYRAQEINGVLKTVNMISSAKEEGLDIRNPRHRGFINKTVSEIPNLQMNEKSPHINSLTTFHANLAHDIRDSILGPYGSEGQYVAPSTDNIHDMQRTFWNVTKKLSNHQPHDREANVDATFDLFLSHPTIDPGIHKEMTDHTLTRRPTGIGSNTYLTQREHARALINHPSTTPKTKEHLKGIVDD